MGTIFVLAVACVISILIFDYTNRFHDASNIIATFEFLGPLLGGSVAICIYFLIHVLFGVL